MSEDARLQEGMDTKLTQGRKAYMLLHRAGRLVDGQWMEQENPEKGDTLDTLQCGLSTISSAIRANQKSQWEIARDRNRDTLEKYNHLPELKQAFEEAYEAAAEFFDVQKEQTPYKQSTSSWLEQTFGLSGANLESAIGRVSEEVEKERITKLQGGNVSKAVFSVDDLRGIVGKVDLEGKESPILTGATKEYTLLSALNRILLENNEVDIVPYVMGPLIPVGDDLAFFGMSDVTKSEPLWETARRTAEKPDIRDELDHYLWVLGKLHHYMTKVVEEKGLKLPTGQFGYNGWGYIEGISATYKFLGKSNGEQRVLKELAPVVKDILEYCAANPPYVIHGDPKMCALNPRAFDYGTNVENGRIFDLGEARWGILPEDIGRALNSMGLDHKQVMDHTKRYIQLRAAWDEGFRDEREHRAIYALMDFMSPIKEGLNYATTLRRRAQTGSKPSELVISEANGRVYSASEYIASKENRKKIITALN